MIEYIEVGNSLVQLLHDFLEFNVDYWNLYNNYLLYRSFQSSYAVCVFYNTLFLIQTTSFWINSFIDAVHLISECLSRRNTKFFPLYFTIVDNSCLTHVPLSKFGWLLMKKVLPVVGNFLTTDDMFWYTV
jgi:hypothetical protein